MLKKTKEKKPDILVLFIEQTIANCDKWLSKHQKPIFGDNNVSHDYLAEYVKWETTKEFAIEIDNMNIMEKMSGISTTSTT